MGRAVGLREWVLCFQKQPGRDMVSVLGQPEQTWDQLQGTETIACEGKGQSRG